MVQLPEQLVLSLTPAPLLERIWGSFKYIWADIQREQASAGQLRALVRSIAQLLGVLYDQDCLGNLKDSDSAPLDELYGVLENINQFLFKLQTNGEPLKLLLSKCDRVAQIDAYQDKILVCARAFKIPQLFDMEAVQTAIDDGRAADQKALFERFDVMEKDNEQLEKGLDIQHSDIKAMAVSIRRYLKNEPQLGEDRQRQFLELVNRHLSHIIRRARMPDGETCDWMVSKYDVEFGQEPIGTGGL
ncbi:hypothetical protein FIBSPDRAFT_969072 [Athelia psychrophila]|uniref:Uncharacterized protein n=1 Tax=Athelia psychrophila TaxID=1759441 RepID=A0A167TWF8_9AGAM|nr:hypothetical protein FIBSPDRAFT_969072 [Fibularhizoctonia sp. CBS 109695]